MKTRGGAARCDWCLTVFAPPVESRSKGDPSSCAVVDVESSMMPPTRVRGGAGGQAHCGHTLTRMWTSVNKLPTYGWVGAPPNVDPQSQAGLPLATVAVHLGLGPNPVAHASPAARPATAAAEARRRSVAARSHTPAVGRACVTTRRPGGHRRPRACTARFANWLLVKPRARWRDCRHGVGRRCVSVAARLSLTPLRAEGSHSGSAEKADVPLL